MVLDSSHSLCLSAAMITMITWLVVSARIPHHKVIVFSLSVFWMIIGVLVISFSNSHLLISESIDPCLKHLWHFFTFVQGVFRIFPMSGWMCFEIGYKWEWVFLWV